MARRRADFGAIRKLRSGRWQARYIDRSGARHARTFATRGDASRHLAGVRADLDRGEWVDPARGRETFAVYAGRWLATRRVRGRPLAPSTVELYRWLLERHLLPTLGSLELRHIDPPTVRRWWSGMTGPRTPSALTAAKAYRLLHAVCGTAVADGELARNPCAIAGAGQESSPERPAVSVPEVYALAEAIDPRWRAMVLLAAFAGLRIGELGALTRADLDLVHATVRVRAAKSEAGRRVIALPPHLLPDLEEHVTRCAAPGADGLVFVGPHGGRLNRNNFTSRHWRPAVEALGLTGVHFHDLRGTAATLAAISGATTRELMARLGHATPSVAMRYQRATADRDAAVARALSELVAGAVVPLDAARSKRT